MKLLKRILKNEAGQILPTVLIMLVLGGLLVVPVLSLMTTNLTANRIVVEETSGIYAADAGIQDALWKLGNDVDPFPEGADSYDLPENINGMTVTVDKQALEGDLYTLKSTSRLNGEVVTVIVAQAAAGSDFSWFFDSAITGKLDVIIKPGTEIVGDVTYGDDITYKDRDQIDGDLIYDPDLADSWPTTALLSNYYLAQVATAPDIAAGTTIDVGGYDAISPRSIWNGGPAHALGNLTITGSGWARLDGTLYVEGNFTSQPGCTIDLNDQTIFVNGTIEIKPGSSIVGSGCIIAVGNIEFKPNLSSGDKFVGVNEDITYTSTSAPKGTFLLSKFTADITGTVDLFRVNCSNSGQVKVAIYEDVAGAPGNLKVAVDTFTKAMVETSTDVIEGWNDIIFPETAVQAGTAYWLAANSSAAIIRINNSTGGVSRYKAAPYAGFTTFPDPAGSGFTTLTNTTYLFAGHNTPFVFVMSIEGTSTMYPGGTLYGSIAGDAEVELKPGCSLTLTSVPEDGLNFPGITGSSGTGEGGNSPPLLNYNIQ